MTDNQMLCFNQQQISNKFTPVLPKCAVLQSEDSKIV